VDAAADAESVWDALMEIGRTRAVRPVGSRALNMVRIEAGFVLPNLDFVSAAHTLYLGTERSPLELGLAWLVDFDKGHFTGRRALLAEQARGPRRRLVGLDIEGTKTGPQCASLQPHGRARRRRGALPPRPGRRPASATSHSRWWRHPTLHRLHGVGGDLPES